MELICDTREQKPLWTDAIKKTLNVGDYTTVALEGRFHVERKSPSDLYGSLIQGHERFKKEFERAQEQGVELIIMVECDEKQFYSKSWPGGWRLKTKGNVLAKITKGFKENRGCEIIWCENRDAMRFEMLNRFMKEEGMR